MGKRHYLEEPKSEFSFSVSLENPIFLVGLILVVLIVAYMLHKKKK